MGERKTIFNPRLRTDNSGLTEVIDVVADGNCLPRALSVSENGSENRHGSIRSELATELSNHIDFYNEITLSGQTLLKAAPVDRNWMAHDLCFVYANMKQCGVALHQSVTQSEGYYVSNNASFSYLPFRHEELCNNPRKLKWLHICWSDPLRSFHFMSVTEAAQLPAPIYGITILAKHRPEFARYIQTAWKLMPTYIPFQSPRSNTPVLSNSFPKNILDCGKPRHELQKGANSETEYLVFFNNQSKNFESADEDCCFIGEKCVVSDRVEDNPVSDFKTVCSGTLSIMPPDHVSKQENINFESSVNDTHPRPPPCPTRSAGNFRIEVDMAPLFNGTGSVSCTKGSSASGSSTPLGIKRPPGPDEIMDTTVFDSLDAAIESITISQAEKGFKVVKKDATNGRLRMQCSRSGKPNESLSSGVRRKKKFSEKCDCPWKINLDKKLQITAFHDTHNHEPVPEDLLHHFKLKTALRLQQATLSQVTAQVNTCVLDHLKPADIQKLLNQQFKPTFFEYEWVNNLVKRAKKQLGMTESKYKADQLHQILKQKEDSDESKSTKSKRVLYNDLTSRFKGIANAASQDEETARELHRFMDECQQKLDQNNLPPDFRKQTGKPKVKRIKSSTEIALRTKK